MKQPGGIARNSSAEETTSAPFPTGAKLSASPPLAFLFRSAAAAVEIARDILAQWIAETQHTLPVSALYSELPAFVAFSAKSANFVPLLRDGLKHSNE